MSKMRTLLVVCAMGYATSTMIKRAISEYLDAHQIRGWNIETTALNMSGSLVQQADIIVSSLELNPADYTVPIVNGVSLISGIGQEEALAEILGHIRRIEETDT